MLSQSVIDIEERVAGVGQGHGRPAHRVWGGELRLDPGARVRLQTVSLPPITVSRGEWQGCGCYRRSASVVRKVEQGLYRIHFVEGGRMINGGTERLPDVGDQHLSVVDVSVGYYAEFIPNPGETLSITVVLVPHHLLASRLAGIRQPAPAVPLDVPAASLARKIAEFLLDEGEDIAIPVRDQAIELFLSMIARCVGATGEEPASEPIRERRMGEIVRFVRDNVANPDLSACLAAENLGISQRYLSLLMQQNGTSFSQLIRQTRVALACDLLAAAEMKRYQVSEIGVMSGFKSPPHFARVFKEEVGVPPGEYRADPRPHTH